MTRLLKVTFGIVLMTTVVASRCSSDKDQEESAVSSEEGFPMLEGSDDNTFEIAPEQPNDGAALDEPDPMLDDSFEEPIDEPDAESGEF